MPRVVQVGQWKSENSSQTCSTQGNRDTRRPPQRVLVKVNKEQGHRSGGQDLRGVNTAANKEDISCIMKHCYHQALMTVCYVWVVVACIENKLEFTLNYFFSLIHSGSWGQAGWGWGPGDVEAVKLAIAYKLNHPFP